MWSLLPVLAVVVWLGVGAVVVLVCNGAGSALTIVRSGRPRGQRWVIATLAQRPGTRLSAVLLARDLMAQLPVSAVLVSAAGSQQFLDHYLRLGFTEGRNRRVHRIIT